MVPPPPPLPKNPRGGEKKEDDDAAGGEMSEPERLGRPADVDGDGVGVWPF